MGRQKRQAASVPSATVDAEINRISNLDAVGLRREWRTAFGTDAPSGLTKDLLARALAYRLQERAFGTLPRELTRMLQRLRTGEGELQRRIKIGSIIVREYDGSLHEVVVVPGGFCWQGKTFDSLSAVAKEITGTSWNGPRFFGLRVKRPTPIDAAERNDQKSDVAAPRVGRRSSVRTARRLPSAAS